MFGIYLTVTILFLCLHHVHQYKIANVENSEPDNHFDILVFSQEWPVTICKYWIHDLNGSECVYPNKKNQWTVHGIWPRTVERIYPSFCNKSWAFDPEQIQSIEGELKQAWADIYKGMVGFNKLETRRDMTLAAYIFKLLRGKASNPGTDPYIFWGHEWQKHGTCATELEPFNSQFKYFSKGLEWHQKYSLLDMFNAANIFPSDTKEFIPEEFANAVKAKTKKNPMVGCYTIDGVLYLEEMRLCFDKELNVIDCDPVADKYCDVSKGIIFPANA